MRRLILLSCLICAPKLAAQSQLLPTPQLEPVPIQDNSFLVEEAYNQERGVVQHVSTFSRSEGSDGWMYAFTQEWPVRSQFHQLSYTVPIARNDVDNGSTGLGDIAINYRYQFG
jgi:hypothetical protein